MKSQYSNTKTVQQWAASSTNWLLFVFCLQHMYRHLSGSQRGLVWSFLCWAGRCVILHCLLYCTVCYTALSVVLHCLLYCTVYYTALSVVLHCLLYCTVCYTALQGAVQSVILHYNGQYSLFYCTTMGNTVCYTALQGAIQSVYVL